MCHFHSTVLTAAVQGFTAIDEANRTKQTNLVDLMKKAGNTRMAASKAKPAAVKR